MFIESLKAFGPDCLWMEKLRKRIIIQYSYSYLWKRIDLVTKNLTYTLITKLQEKK